MTHSSSVVSAFSAFSASDYVQITVSDGTIRELISALIRNEIDIAFISSQPGLPLNFHQTGSSKLFLAVHRALCYEYKILSPDDLVNLARRHPLIRIAQKNKNDYDAAEHYICHHHPNRFFSMYASNALIQQKMVSANAGISVVHEGSICPVDNVKFIEIEATEKYIYVAWNPLYYSTMKNKILSFLIDKDIGTVSNIRW